MNVKASSCFLALGGASLVAIMPLSGCSSGRADSPRPAGLAGLPGQAKVESVSSPIEIASVSALGAEVTFYDATLGGETAVGIRETGSAFAKQLVVRPLMEQHLTSQEIYLALAPQGAIAPPALVAAQAVEAARMNRSPDVRYVTVDASAFVEKSLYACEVAILNGAASNGLGSNYVIDVAGTKTGCDSTCQEVPGNSSSCGSCCGYEYYPGNGACTYTTKTVVFGACNESSTVSFTLHAGEEYASNCSSFLDIGDVTVGAGGYAYWYWNNPNGGWYDLVTDGPAWTCSGINYDYMFANVP